MKYICSTRIIYSRYMVLDRLLWLTSKCRRFLFVSCASIVVTSLGRDTVLSVVALFSDIDDPLWH